jgi:hypothetical protein
MTFNRATRDYWATNHISEKRSASTESNAGFTFPRSEKQQPFGAVIGVFYGQRRHRFASGQGWGWILPRLFQFFAVE